MWFTKWWPVSEKIVKIKWLTKWELDPYFEVFGSDDKATKFNGSITGAELRSYEYEGKPRDVFVLHLVDEQWEKYKLSCSFTQLSRSLLNNLCWMPNYNNVEISLYVKGSVGNDGKEYVNPRISVWKDGQIQSWKYKLDEIPKPEAIKNSKGEAVQNDYSAVDEFWKAKIKDIDTIAKSSNVSEEDLDVPF